MPLVSSLLLLPFYLLSLFSVGQTPRGKHPEWRDIGFIPRVAQPSSPSLYFGRDGRARRLGQKSDPAEWTDGCRVLGEIRSLKTNGDYEVELEFEDVELRNWLKDYIKHKPSEALELIAEVLPGIAPAMAASTD